MVKINENKNTGITVTASYQKDKYQISELETINTMDSFKLERGIIEDISHIHFTSYYMMKKLIPKYTGIIEKIKRINESITFSLDTNDDPRESWNGNLKKVLKDIDIVFLNEKEALKISGSVNVKGAVEILKGLVDTVVVKLGSRGGMAYFSEETVEVKAIKTDFLDSTGAGDNFDAGFIFGHLKSLDLKSSLKIANICGGKSVGSMGGVGERERFLQLKKEINSII